LSVNEPNLDDLLNEIENKSHITDPSQELSPEELSQLHEEVEQCHQDIVRSIEKNSQKAEQIKGPSLRVLLIDDSIVIRIQLKKIFSEYQVLFDEADNGPDALDYIEQFKGYDLITLDLNLPGLNGMDILNAITATQQQEKDINIVVISTESEHATITRALSLGVKDYITKPFRRLETQETLFKAIGIEPSDIPKYLKPSS
jgi:CheY-like chemotaxis protein